MLEPLFKLLPIVTIAGGAAASGPNIRNQFDKIAQSSSIVATQNEVNGIAQILSYDILSEGTRPKPEEFQDYVRKNLLNKPGQNRDTSYDVFGTRFGIAYDDANHRGYVISAGPDKQFNTEDDIFATITY